MNRLDAAPAGRTASDDLSALHAAMRNMAAFARSSGDEEQSVKFNELAAKLDKGYLTAAFCGHFSAGKSTLVNALCGASLLPSSPVPTSANVVTIVNGEPSARLTYRGLDGSVAKERSIPLAELPDFAVDGEGVASIDVSYPVGLLGSRMAIVDTPGVDSTDAAHRAATESALHLADVVFYVTDCNHVLSDVNFRFLRGLSEWGKPVYLLVNQIDKHREEEIPFARFRDGIMEALEAWRIRIAGLLFLSLREPGHPLSQWTELLKVLRKLQDLRPELIRRSADRSARHLAERFLESLRGRLREEKGSVREHTDGEEDPDTLASERARLTEALEDVRTAQARERDALRSELERLAANANLTPAETREKVRAFLTSAQPGFKAGWFAAAAKTEAERQKRLNVLAEDFNRQISAHLRGYFQDHLRSLAKQAGWNDTAMEASLASAFPPVSADWIRERINPGIGADGQAVLHLAAELGNGVKTLYKKAALEWYGRLEAIRQPHREEEEKLLLRQSEELRKKEEAVKRRLEWEREARAQYDSLLSLLPAAEAVRDEELPVPAPLPETAAAGAGSASGKSGDQPEKIAGATRSVSDEAGQPAYALGAPAGAIESLEQAALLLSRIPALVPLAESLSAKAGRFRASRFTIALFGAFSAGKSSFANALIGVPALPVSPNPTTAAINRIVAPTDTHPDGTAWVTMKTREAMIEDIRHSLRRLGVDRGEIEAAGGDAERLLNLAARMEPRDVHPRGKPHLAFLNAAREGWNRYADRLDTRFAAEGEAYRAYAADEQASCFVAEIDLAVDCPLTRGGAVLVDTPGADSINARHTGVAFEYIKNADAVLFVTYYNHAFTEADRQFLYQLGSVKDVFELDKMFFVINAADLAASEAELQAVKNHVEAQLLKHGIRRPRLFAVSSLNGLKAKAEGRRDELERSGLAGFEESFRAFAGSELGQLAADSARKEIERADRQLRSWLSAATADAASREAKAKALQRRAQEWRAKAEEEVPAAVALPLRQEAADQLYHLRQRVYYRFGDHYQTAFHPSVLQDDGRDLKRMLAACWDDLKRSVGEDLLQELRAAGLRLQVALNRAVEERAAAAASKLAAEGFAADPAARAELELRLGEPFAEGPAFEGKKLWAIFKSPKHFFEGEGKERLRAQAADTLFAAVDEWLSGLRESWQESVTAGCRAAMRQCGLRLARDLEAYARNLLDSAAGTAEKQKVEEIRRAWDRFFEE